MGAFFNLSQHLPRRVPGPARNYAAAGHSLRTRCAVPPFVISSSCLVQPILIKPVFFLTNMIIKAELSLIVMRTAAMFQAMSVLAGPSSTELKENTMKYIEQDGRFFVSARELETKTGIAVKPLPGRSEFAACSADQCILVDRLDQDGDTIWISLKQIADGFGAKWSADENREFVLLEFDESAVRESSSQSQGAVGGLAPQIRLPLLGGGALSIDELRGKRVLINSWASW